MATVDRAGRQVEGRLVLEPELVAFEGDVQLLFEFEAALRPLPHPLVEEGVARSALYHEIHNEPEQGRVLADIVAWLDAHRA